MSISDKVIEILKSHREYVKRINRVENEISKAITNSKEAYSKFLALENVIAAVYFAIDLIEYLEDSFKKHCELFTPVEREREFIVLRMNLQEIINKKKALVKVLKKYRVRALPIEKVAEEVSEEITILKWLIENHVSYERLLIRKIKFCKNG